ncbi:DUF1931 family protein [Actinoplanes siamensis]|uniref:DUF1931 family protein n=1 Tax=Actinoplanes siamensis TaxID=1223317 RepID=A0A919KAA2_9ACTN|nr:DUF1931 family protein [Actinoplanes siamensis]GIF02735.1 hypothetical protein Asi03nite_02730 [Actinoplanes siamensis]
MPVFGVAKFERFFRLAAELDVDKDDLKRFSDFVEHKLYDLLLMGQAKASANLRDLVEPYDLPITKGLQENIHEFRKMDDEIELKPILDRLATYPPLDRAPSEETQTQLPEIVGGLGLVLAKIFKITDPEVKNPQSEHWERAMRIFDELM